MDYQFVSYETAMLSRKYRKAILVKGHGEQVSAEWFEMKGMKRPFTNCKNGSLGKKEDENTISLEVEMQ